MYKYQSDAWANGQNLNGFVSILELKLNCVYIHAREERKWNLKFENFIEKLISKTDRNDDLLKFIESFMEIILSTIYST